MPEIKIIKHNERPACSICEDRGIIFNVANRKSQVSFIEVCRCIEEACICDKKPPYMVFNHETRTMQNCACRKTRASIDRINFLFKNSNIPVRFRYRRLFEFETKASDKEIEKNLALALDNAQHFIMHLEKLNSESVKGLYFFGAPGSGKTFISCLILNEIILRYQMNVRYVKITRDFFNQIRATFSFDSQAYGKGEDIFKDLMNKDVLVIDDFGVQADTAWEQRTLYDLIDARYEADKPTILTSNLQPEEIDKMNLFGGRILSRLKEMTDFQPIICTDYRENFY
ncbi:MAG: ATP-binding protein [Spirochaetia bacterium]|nr:ATP-binding protein [Spirochaetia bacterium]